MPVIDISYRELVSLSGIEKEKGWFEETIPMLGASYEGSDADTMRFEFFPNRPDHYSVEGVARTLRAFEAGKLSDYTVVKGKGEVFIGDRVAGIRPYIVCAVARDVRLSDAALTSIINLQEKLHTTVGRKRKKVAVGLHDLSSISFPVRYDAVEGEEVSFIPLGEQREMTPAQAVIQTDKGREFGWIVGEGPYPLLTDASGMVLSMPPIINGNTTQLREGKRDVFVDVTGTDLRTCTGVLNIISAALADRGGRLESVNIVHKGTKMKTPDMSRRKISLKLRQFNSITGLHLNAEEVASLLRKMGHETSVQNDAVDVRYPPYRMDIMHPVDMIEDAAIAYGYGTFGHSLPSSQTVGSLLEITRWKERIAELMIGYGYSQVITFMISGSALEFDRMRIAKGKAVTIRNPIAEDRDILRTSLLPGLLSLLEANRHNELPQQVFETGDVHRPERRAMFAAVSAHAKASFAEVKSLAEALKRDMRSEIGFAPSSDSRFIEGRQMNILSRGESIGVLGELHPEVITNFNLTTPITAIEFEIEAFVLR